MKDHEMKVAYHWLCSIPEIGVEGKKKLIEEAGGVRKVCNLKKGAYGAILTARQIKAFEEALKLDPEKTLEHTEKSGVNFVAICDEEYPKRLRGLLDAPLGLFVKGQLPSEDMPTVAITGARIDTEGYCNHNARDFANGLARAGIQVISSMALGVDGISQKAAISAGGYTAAVLGNGVDVCYPPENRMLYDDLIKKGAVISEYSPAEHPSAERGVERKRLISGLADAVLVVGARRKSGALITADFAMTQGRRIFAIPGRITDRLSDGCNDLIKQGIAEMVTCPEDIIKALNGTRDKERQLEIILKHNPALDDEHAWVRTIDDILTFKEAMDSHGYEGCEKYAPDYTRADAEAALETGEITIYSADVIKPGTFVTPSQMEADAYSSDGITFTGKVSIKDVAWIDALQGQYAPL